MGRAAPRLTVGVDFDNTIASYDRLLKELAVEAGYVSADIPQHKQVIRDCIRQHSDGELLWRQLQARMYGECMPQAELFPGVLDFFLSARESGAAVFIISHKTRHSNLYNSGADFHAAARRWLEDKGFFDRAGAGLPVECVFFEPQREEKIQRIMHTGCDVFVDDLPEVFLEPTFPGKVEKVLFCPQEESIVVPGAKILSDWSGIRKHILG